MRTILIVDDDEVDREVASRCLIDIEGFELRYAEDGREALESIAQAPPDLVVTDLRMPGMDGLELVTRIREDHPLIPVVLMTSYGNEKIAVQALRDGAASYVPKDDLKQELADTVDQVLELMDARQSRHKVLRCLEQREMTFELENDPKLISPFAGFFQESLEAVGFGNESVRTQVGMAMMEALSNAIIHGNLEVDSELRAESTAPYYALIEERRQLEPYSKRRVRCVSRETTTSVEYVVTDEGPGFDHEALPDPRSPESLTRVQGRGLMLIRTFMDEVEHNDRGNTITMRKHHPHSD